MALVFETLVEEDINAGVSTGVTVSNPGGGTLSGKQVCLSSFGVGQASETATWAPGSIASGGQATTTIAVPSAAVGDYVVTSHSQILANPLIISGHVSAAGVVTVVIANFTGSPVTVASGTLKVLVLASR